jgi:peptidylprolyl isomerase
MNEIPFAPRRAPRLLLAVAGLLLGGPAAHGGDVIARVGGIDVTVEEVRRYLSTLGAQEQSALAKEPALLSQVVRGYLARQAVLREARAKKWDQQPAVMAQLDRGRDQLLAELYLQAVSKPPDAYPSDAEVQAAYEANKAAFEVPRQYRVAQIFIAVPRGAARELEENARRRLEEATRKLRQEGADFAAVARTDSDEREASRSGGESAWLAEEQMVPGIRSAVTSLRKGAVSDPLRLDDGWHLVKLLDSRPVRTRPLAEVREALSARLRAERARANREAYLARLVEQSAPAIDELSLSRVLASGRQTAR